MQPGLSGGIVTRGVALPVLTLRKLLHPGPLGGGPGGADLGYSGVGGGSLVFVAEGEITISGAINANGGNGAPDTNAAGVNGGGGGGGIVILASKTGISNTGAINAMGGAGAAGSTSGSLAVTASGGGGWVHLLAPSITAGTIMTTGGAGGVSDNGNGFGYGGGASGGSGGNPAASGSAATTGSTGLIIQSTVADPATLFLP